MTEYNRCDVVLVSFIFSDETGERRRPAVIVSSDAHHQSRQEAIIAAINCRTDRILLGDHLISDWQDAGLLFPSVATGIIRTIKQGMIAKKIGTMPRHNMQAIEDNQDPPPIESREREDFFTRLVQHSAPSSASARLWSKGF